MKLVKNISFLVLTIGFLSSCEDSESKEKKPQDVFEGTEKFSEKKKDPLAQEIGFAFPETFLEDQDCQERNDFVNISAIDFYSWDAGINSKFDKEISGTSSQDGFSTGDVTRVVVGYKEHLDCTSFFGCDSKPKIIDLGKNLKICRSEARYSRFSWEAISLSVATNIGRASEYYRSIAERPVAGVARVLLLPEVKRFNSTSNEEKNTVIANNMAYAPNMNGERSFIVYPFEKEWHSFGESILWENPWVVAHEYGHHIYSSELLAGITSSNSLVENLNSHEHAPVYEPVETDTNEQTVKLTAEKISISTHIAAINEAFADLFANQSRGDNHFEIDLINCLKVSRNPKSSVFFDGSLKALNDGDYQDFLYQVKAKRYSCNDKSFHDVHIVGAVIASFVHDLLQASNQPIVDDSEAFGKFLINWVRRSNQYIKTSNKTTAEISIADFIEHALAEASSTSKLNSEQCSLISERLPIFSDSLQKYCN